MYWTKSVLYALFIYSSKPLGNRFIFTHLPPTLFFFLFQPHLWHMAGVELELQLLASATATATLDLSCICDLHHRSRQCWTIKPLSKARDRTYIHMDASYFPFCWATTGSLKVLKSLLWKLKKGTLFFSLYSPNTYLLSIYYVPAVF